MDETLIHCLDENDLKVSDGVPTSKGQRRPFDSVISIKYSKTEMLSASIYIRPGVLNCLRKLKSHYEIAIFTASHACYANKVLELLDPHNELLTCRLYRDHCYKSEDGVYIKDLRIIANRDQKDIILIDNSAYSYGFQPNNGIPIIPYYDATEDNQLEELADFLISIHDVPDVRPALRNAFKLNLITENLHDFEELKISLMNSLN